MSSYPLSGTYIQSIRSSSRTLRLSENIAIEDTPIRRLLLSEAFIGSFGTAQASHGLAFPLNFPSPLSELNFLAVLSLLGFGSGYRVPLLQATGRGASDTIRALAFSLYISSSTDSNGDHLSARGMAAIGVAQVAEIMGVNIYFEKPHEAVSGVTVGELGGPLYDLVGLITRTLNETGKILQNFGYPNLGAFVLEGLKEGERALVKHGPGADVEVIMEKLVRAIPAFRDMAYVNSQPIYCFKKALSLIRAVEARFGRQSPPPFYIPSTADSPVLADDILPSLLIHLGVIDLSASPTLSHLFPEAANGDRLPSLLKGAQFNAASLAQQPKEWPVLTIDQAYILRAAAIDACELIVDSASDLSTLGDELKWIKQISPPELNRWLWWMAKNRQDYQVLEQFLVVDTPFF